jgi:type 1 fimbriae regulatory protein FimB
MAYRHGLRVQELVNITLSQINLESRQLYVKRLKGSISNYHDLDEDEIKRLKRWLKERGQNKGAGSDRLFLTERGEGMQPHAVNHVLKTMGERAGFDFPVYPHMLRHACGVHLANQGVSAFTIQAYMAQTQH